MNQIPTYVIIIFAQLFIFAIVAAVFFFSKWRESLHEKDGKIETSTNTKDKNDIIKPDASTYLFMESKLTGGRCEELSFQDVEQLSESDHLEQIILKLRTDLLTIENELAKDLDNRDEEFWLKVVAQFKQLLRDNNLFGAIKSQLNKDEDDDIGLGEMMKNQAANITQLREYITGVVKNEKVATHIGLVLDIIEGQQHELTDCIFILEDQNTFLRDQIQQLCRPDEDEVTDTEESAIEEPASVTE